MHPIKVQTTGKVDVFHFRDYRKYLAAVYEFRKDSEYGFSYRAFARRAGMGAPNYLKLVMDDQRNLTPHSAQKFADALGLKSQAADYFCDLVVFNQAKSAPERERAYLRLRRYRAYRDAFRLDSAHAAYHSEWYIIAIRELVVCRGFVDDPKLIAASLRPPIRPREAENALNVLLLLGFIARDSKGNWTHKEPLLATGDDKPLGHHVTNFHRTMLEKAAQSLDTIPRDEREISGLTLGLNGEQVERFKQRLFDLREEFFQESIDNQPDRVVQINFQLFPLTKIGCESES